MVIEEASRSRTYPTKCRDCGGAIFFHTNGYGDAVLFDELGPPWPIHPCYESRLGGAVLQDRVAYRAYMVSVYGKPFTPPARSPAAPPSSQKRRVRKSAPVLIERAVDTTRCEPGNFVGRTLQIVGFVHDVHEGWALTRFASPGSVGYAVYRNVIGVDRFSQLTVMDGDFMSYTVVVPAPSVALPRGAVVTLIIDGVEVIDRPMFICRSLSVVRWERD